MYIYINIYTLVGALLEEAVQRFVGEDERAQYIYIYIYIYMYRHVYSLA